MQDNIIMGLALVFGLSSFAFTSEKPFYKSEPLLNNVQQLVSDAMRSGEAYFSADGSKLILQAERAENHNPFYQIYELDLNTGVLDRISNGIGKTTCGWFHPDSDRALFASTHLDPDAFRKQYEESERRRKGDRRKYAWDYDPHYDIFLTQTSKNDRTFHNLTNEFGYDAEGSYSPDGQWILYASNALAYKDPTSKVDENPSFYIDLFKVRADGSEKIRLTSEEGYDGGPFFSADGSLITWRKFSADGRSAEIWVMNSDGSSKRKLTSMNAISWAPYFHPSGKYIIFATNVLSHRNFELYMVATSGGEPVRVTSTDGFDGLPVFSPDGSKLVWSSTRTRDRKAHVFMADWDHAGALELINLK